MTDVKNAAKQREAQPANRDEYAAPKLKVFGAVGALTQAGTLGTAESMPGQGTLTMMA